MTGPHQKHQAPAEYTICDFNESVKTNLKNVSWRLGKNCLQNLKDFDLIYMQAQVSYRAKRLDQAQALLEQFITVQTQRQDANPAGATDASAALAEAYSLLARIAEDQGRLDDAFGYLSRVEDAAARHPARMRQALSVSSKTRWMKPSPSLIVQAPRRTKSIKPMC